MLKRIGRFCTWTISWTSRVLDFGYLEALQHSRRRNPGVRNRIGGFEGLRMELNRSSFMADVSVSSLQKDGKARVQEPPDLVPSGTRSRTGETIGTTRGEPIAPNLGVDYSFPPHLEYAYPPPDGNILTNIVNALIAVPRFYTQVLHLMNKMNLPAPFRPARPTPPLPPAPAQVIPKRQAVDLSSGESELESSEEEDGSETEADGTLHDPSTSEKDTERKLPSRKQMRSEAILGPALDKGASHEAAGVKAITVSKGLTIKKKAPVLQIKITPKSVGKEPVEELKEPGARQQEIAEEAVEQRTTATQEELEAGKLHASDTLSLPIFKNYTAGNPTQVLYIKNLAKDATVEDLYYIYGAFFSSWSEAMQLLRIKLMQEGRMRGQAFVYWPSVDLAKVALAGSHGYVHKGKPMVVQFGRNQAASGTDEGGASAKPEN